MTFSDPLYLLLFLPALLWTLWAGRRAHGMARARRRLAVGLRCVLVTLLVLALAGWQAVRPNKGVSVVFVLDGSDSLPAAQRDAARTYISQSLQAMGPDDRAGLVVFGKDPVIDVNCGSLRSLGKIYAHPDPSGSDIAAAVRLASAALGEGTAKRLVLLSDGNETQGDAAQAAEVAASDDAQIDFLPPPALSAHTPEALIDDLALPGAAVKGEPFSVRVSAQATAPMSGTLRLDRDGVPVARVPVHLSPGANSLVIPQTAGDPGFYRYRATLEADGDADPRNNVGLGFLSVAGRPRVLLLEGKPGTGAALAAALSSHNLLVTRAGPEGVPTRPEDVQAYDSVLLSDFSADGMAPAQMTLLASAARDTGMGLGMIGGEDSFLPGGYYETPIADALPVDLNVRQRKTFPSTTIVLVADTSGSMGMLEDGVPKVKIAASAAAATVRMMSAEDYVGVAGSTDDISFVAPIQHPTDKNAIAAQIGRLDVGGGGIYIRPSLEFADKALSGVSTRVRHLILLADGDDSDEQDGAIARAQEMVGKGMTVSVVAIGTGKDVPFLQALAAAGRGQFYLAAHANQLQRLFTRDTSLVSRSAIEEGAFLPKADPGDDVLRGLPLQTMPALYAYDLTGDRPLARVPMRTAKNDPLLAFWQYGLGTTMAWTSDAQPKWARPWMSWPGFGAFWAQTVRSTLRRSGANRVQVSARHENGRDVLQLGVFDAAGLPVNALNAKVRVLSPDGKGQDVAIVPTGPGRYEGAFSPSGAGGGTGSYIVSVAENAGNGAPPRVSRAGFAVAYPPEYQAVGPNLPLLTELAHASGGQALTNTVQPFRRAARPGRSTTDLWPLLLLCTAILLPLDIAVRRLALPLDRLWAAALSRLPRRRPQAVSVPAATPAMARLHQAKQSVQSTPPASPETGDASSLSPVTPSAPPAKPAPSPPVSAPLSTAQRLLDAKRREREKL